MSDNHDGHIMKIMRDKTKRPDSLKYIVRAYGDYETFSFGLYGLYSSHCLLLWGISRLLLDYSLPTGNGG